MARRSRGTQREKEKGKNGRKQTNGSRPPKTNRRRVM